MPRLVTIGRVAICLYADDHVPPHFPVRTPDGEAQVRIDTLEMMRGSIQRSDLEVAIRWALIPENRLAISAEWDRLNERD
jgi:hypothetical protein